MEAIGFYLVKSAVWTTGFGLVYLLFLRNERFFHLNRIYLVAGILVSLILPLISVRYYIDIPAVQAGATAGALRTGTQGAGSGHGNILYIINGLWVAGVLVILTRYAIQVFPVLKALRNSKPEPGFPVQLIRSSEFPDSFSLFSFVVVNPSVSETEAREIMNHEMVHIRQMHWLDLMLSGILCAVQWFNPAAWIYYRFVRQNHEYLADEEALQRTSDPAVYRAALLNQIAGSPVIDLGNFFSFSLNKKRFNMMKNKISSPYRKLRLLIILPVAAIVLYAFAEPQYRVVAAGDETDGTEITASVSKTVKGVVMSEDGTPLEGAVIVIKGTTEGTVADKQGHFALKNVPDDGLLVISFVGYETVAVSVSGKDEINISMQLKSVVMKKVQVTPDPPPPPPPGKSQSDMAPPPPPPPPPTAESLKDALLVIDGVKSNKSFSDISPDEISSVKVLKGEHAEKAYGAAGKNGVVEITTKKVEGVKYEGERIAGATGKDKGEKEAFVVVEEMPEFPGGPEAMMPWIYGNIRYPEEAVAAKISGLVEVAFVVSPTGKVTDVRVKRSASPLLDGEAVRVIKSMPDWKPGTQHGKPVSVSFVVPLEFSLKVLKGEKIVR
jgi:TonB family protein